MLSKKHRLGKTSDVQKVFARGRAFFSPLLTIKFLPHPSGHRFTVVVSTKVSKKAVERNRLKRHLREFVRLNLEKFKPGDYAVVLKPKAAGLEGKDLVTNFRQLSESSKLLVWYERNLQKNNKAACFGPCRNSKDLSVDPFPWPQLAVGAVSLWLLPPLPFLQWVQPPELAALWPH